MTKLIFATGNNNKLKEIREIMENAGFAIISSKDAGIDLDVEETGTTFEENALIKAVLDIRALNIEEAVSIGYLGIAIARV